MLMAVQGADGAVAVFRVDEDDARTTVVQSDGTDELELVAERASLANMGPPVWRGAVDYLTTWAERNDIAIDLHLVPPIIDVPEGTVASLGSPQVRNKL